VVELAAALLAVTVAIQAWIVYTTARSLTKPADATQAATLRQFNLGVGSETVLTAAPLLITLALAVAIIFAARQ
jgi:heme/copper-type cytochrome/quinol oxidase subunit 2